MMNFKRMMSSLLIMTVIFSCSSKREVLEANNNEQALDNLAKRAAKLEEGNEKDQLIAKLMAKLKADSLAKQNQKALSLGEALAGHTPIYPFKGVYKVMVIPVQFSNKTFDDEGFFANRAQDYLFGDNANSLTTYYKHASLGKLKVEGVVTDVITVDKTLEEYGEAVEDRRQDKNARALTADALVKLREKITDRSWWREFDRWDLSDYDEDKNFHEPDGFIDAVVLVYAGKSQAACQASFDPAGTRPPSSEVPAGPTQAAAVECFNRIWPHRSGIFLSEDHPEYQEKGPVVEGQQRSSLGGLKINENLFASDYNMQSEYSDLSTFIHEFGHSLSLPDIYSYGSKPNSTGFWEIMSSNANLQAQEMSSYAKLSLGWLEPKVIKQGEKTSAYLGVFNYVSQTQRDLPQKFDGPVANDEGETIISRVPEFDEDVYRSLAILTKPTFEKNIVLENVPARIGVNAAYSGRVDLSTKKLSFRVDVPESGDASFSFDINYFIETETNFNSKEEEIKVVTDFDMGYLFVEGDKIDEYRLYSGDNNFNTLNETHPQCEETRVLALRKILISGGELSEEEQKEFSSKLKLCRVASWLNKSYDLSAYRGKKVTVEIAYVTDPAYTEYGMVVDNVAFAGKALENFEEGVGANLGEWKLLTEGQEELTHHQFYLLEYRSPDEQFKVNQETLSFNMDNNIKVGTQAMFMDEGENLRERFRLLTYDYQPGVLVWYFNSKYDRSTNDPAGNNGKGYYLVVNSKVKELPLPGVFSKDEYFTRSGSYNTQSVKLNKTIKASRDSYMCFSHTKYATYLRGEVPDCSGVEHRDFMQTLSFMGKKMMYRRERFNDILPFERYNSVGVGQPFRNYEGIRTGLSTFRPAGKSFAPFKAYKEVDGEMVLDKELTAQAANFDAVAEFSDLESEFPKEERFQGDTAVVEKKGFRFKVVEPQALILDQYNQGAKADDNSQWARRPRAKIYIDWDEVDKEKVQTETAEVASFNLEHELFHSLGMGCNHHQD